MGGSKLHLVRPLPHDLDAERSVLGGIILDNAQYAPVKEIISAADFYDKENKLVFQALGALIERGEPADGVTIRGLLEGLGLQEGARIITQLVEAVPSPASSQHYASIVKRKSCLRAGISLATEALDRLYEPSADPLHGGDTLDGLVFDFTELQRNLLQRRRPSMAELYTKAACAITGGQALGLPTGLAGVDQLFGGFTAGELTIIAGRTSQGKTALGCHFAYFLAKTNHSVLYFTLEMTEDQLAERMIARASGVDTFYHKRASFPASHDKERIEKASAELSSNFPLELRYIPTLTPSKVRMECMAHKGIEIAFIDYLGLMRGDHHEKERWREMATVVTTLKQIASEINIPIVLLCQINRDVENKKPPELSNLRDTGTVEEHAGNVFLIWQPPKTHNVELILAKQRTGPAPKKWALNFDRTTSTFTEVEEDE